MVVMIAADQYAQWNRTLVHNSHQNGMGFVMYILPQFLKGKGRTEGRRGKKQSCKHEWNGLLWTGLCVSTSESLLGRSIFWALDRSISVLQHCHWSVLHSHLSIIAHIAFSSLELWGWWLLENLSLRPSLPAGTHWAVPAFSSVFASHLGMQAFGN